jgi:hypothetical protein
MPITKETKARLTLRGREEDKGTFAAMNAKRNGMICAGYKASQLEVHYAVAKGLFNCKKCEAQVKDPENDFYNGSEFWRCTCGQINYIK